jgi:hypothetical protein
MPTGLVRKNLGDAALALKGGAVPPEHTANDQLEINIVLVDDTGDDD